METTTAEKKPPTMAEQMACVAREIALRRNVYRKRVANGQMTQATADKETAAMEAIMQTIKWAHGARRVVDTARQLTRLKNIKRAIDEGAALPEDVLIYEQQKEPAWMELVKALRDLPAESIETVAPVRA